MNRTLLLSISFAALAAACGNSPAGEARAEARPAVSAAESAQPVNPVVEWNKALLRIVRTPGAQPSTVHPTRSFALLHAAIYDAVNSIDRTHAPYLIHLSSRAASQEAAAAAAAREVLIALYPSFNAQLDAQLQRSLAQVPDGARKTEGVRIGQDVADRILAFRADDGSAAPPLKFLFGTLPGDYQSTPPNFPAQPQFTSWSHIKPFALERASQFRPGPPPALATDAYSDAFDEIKSLGMANSTAASADLALTGRFWNGAIQNYWNEIAQTTALSHGLTTAESARLFALLDLSVADCVIAFYDAKYAYRFWPPVTAIRTGDTDGNPETEADPNWLPEVGKTAPDPSYPGAHAVISAAAAAVLADFFQEEHVDFSVTSEVMPGTQRSFESFAGAAREATLSRIFAGQHFRFDLTAGQRLGREVADVVVDRFLIPHHADKDR